MQGYVEGGERRGNRAQRGENHGRHGKRGREKGNRRDAEARRKGKNMREITDHRLGCGNEPMVVAAMDDQGPGGANHVYHLYVNESVIADGLLKPGVTVHQQIQFQKGPIKENGINGITNEQLLAVVIDRLRMFQSGPFSCRENEVALTKLETAMLWLKKRTLDRQARGVEGTNAK